MKDKEKKTNLLNETGFPFQQWCLETIRNISKEHPLLNFYSTSEWPFTFPPSQGSMLGVHGTADVVAITGLKNKNQKNILIFLVIECKRAKSSIKNWMFIKDSVDSRPTFFYSNVREGIKEDRSIIRHLKFPDLGYASINDYDYCNNAVEFNKELSNINRDQSEKTYKAIKQANHAAHALEENEPKYIEYVTTEISLEQYDYFVVLPVVLTTANLFITEFDYKNIHNGDLCPNDVSYVKKSWLTYEFPLPDFLSFSVRNSQIRVEKRTTFIVNHEHFIEFLKGVKNLYDLEIR